MNVPFVDLAAQYASIKPEIDDAITSVIRETAFIGGPYVAAFEKAYAEYCGTPYAIGVSNGTDALRLALLACGVKPGDEVITVPNTFIATAEAIAMVGGRVRFVDVTPGTWTMDPDLLERAISDRTRAIVPVHLYGRPADMDRILAIANRHGVKVIGDAAQAHGANYQGRGIATLGDAVCFSFYPGKNLGAYGDAGAVVTADPVIAAAVRSLRDHGRAQKYTHDREGFNCRLDGIQAAILTVKLRHLDDWTQKRRAHAARYTELLSRLPALRLPPDNSSTQSVYHLYVVTVPARDELRRQLKDVGIDTGIHYPVPLHLQPAYAHLGLPEGTFPVTEALAREACSLPMFPELSDEQIRFVAEQVEHAMMSVR